MRFVEALIAYPRCEFGVPPHLSKRLRAACCVYEKR